MPFIMMTGKSRLLTFKVCKIVIRGGFIGYNSERENLLYFPSPDPIMLNGIWTFWSLEQLETPILFI